MGPTLGVHAFSCLPPPGGQATRKAPVQAHDSATCEQLLECDRGAGRAGGARRRGLHLRARREVRFTACGFPGPGLLQRVGDGPAGVPRAAVRREGPCWAWRQSLRSLWWPWVSVTRWRLCPGLPRLKPDSPVCRERVPRKPGPRLPGGFRPCHLDRALGRPAALSTPPAGRHFRPWLTLLALAVQRLPGRLSFLREGLRCHSGRFPCGLRPSPPASASAAQAASPVPFRLDVCVLLVSDGDTGLARTPELTYVHGC